MCVCVLSCVTQSLSDAESYQSFDRVLVLWRVAARVAAGVAAGECVMLCERGGL